MYKKINWIDWHVSIESNGILLWYSIDRRSLLGDMRVMLYDIHKFNDCLVTERKLDRLFYAFNIFFDSNKWNQYIWAWLRVTCCNHFSSTRTFEFQRINSFQYLYNHFSHSNRNTHVYNDFEEILNVSSIRINERNKTF